MKRGFRITREYIVGGHSLGGGTPSDRSTIPRDFPSPRHKLWIEKIHGRRQVFVERQFIDSRHSGYDWTDHVMVGEKALKLGSQFRVLLQTEGSHGIIHNMREKIFPNWKSALKVIRKYLVLA